MKRRDIVTYLTNEQNYKFYEHMEYTNATRFTYTAVAAAINQHADSLIIKANYFEWVKDGEKIGHHFGPGAPMPVPPYPRVFEIMYKRDITLRRNTQIIRKDPNEMHVAFICIEE